jgi:hypothetical protein
LVDFITLLSLHMQTHLTSLLKSYHMLSVIYNTYGEIYYVVYKIAVYITAHICT